MAEKLHFDLVSPEKLLYSATADMVVVPGSEGDFGVLAGHAPLISIVRTGVIDVKGSEDGADLKIFVRGGLAEVTPAGCTVLADEALPLEQVTADDLAQRERNAERDIADASTEAEKAAAEKSLVVARDLRRAQAFYASR